MPTAIERITDAVRAGKHGDRGALAAAAEIEPKQVSTILALMRRRGLVTYESPNKVSIDYGSIRLVGEQPARKRRGKAKRANANPSATLTSSTEPAEEDLAQSVSVTFTRAEVARLAVLAHELTSLVATLEASPPLGQDGAYLVRLLAKVHGG